MEPDVRKSNKKSIGSDTKIKSDSGSKGVKRRKIRALQDFDNLKRSSIFQQKHESSTEKTKTKKQQQLDFLPRVAFNAEDSKENSPLGQRMKEKKTPKQKFQLSEDTVNLHKQLLKNKIETQNDNLSLFSNTQDEDIEFKPRLKNKCHNLISSVAKKSQGMTSETEILIDGNTLQDIGNENLQKINNSSLCIEQNKSNLTLKKSIRPSFDTNNDNEGRRISGRQTNFNSVLSKSFKVLTKNLTPDTSGNNQGIFDVTYPIEAEFTSDSSLLTLSSLENKLEKSHNESKILNNIRKSSVRLQSLENRLEKSYNESVLIKSPSGDIVTTNLNQFVAPTERRTSELENTMEESFQIGKDDLKVSIINLITPSPKRQSSFQKDLSLHTPTPTKVSPNYNKADKNNSGVRKSLIRSATFTKVQTDSKYNKDSPKKYITDKPVLDFGTPSKRKRWTKSLGVSVLDSSGNLHLLTAPPANDSLVDSPSAAKTFHKKIEKIGSIQKCFAFASTPMTSSKKQNELHKMLANKQASNSKSIKKTKMPNFAQIHQRAYDKMENIKEMSERKAARAQKLLSGHKPEIGVNSKTSSKSKKALNYSPGKPISNAIPTKIQAVQSTKLPVVKPTKLPVAQPTKIPVVQPVIPNKFNAISTLNKKTLKKKSLEKRGILKPGFAIDKPAKKPVLNQEHLKALANKKHMVTATVENRRKAVQNVRTNRRFELLMQMRNK